MPWSWLNTEYSIHHVQHHPKIDSLQLPANFPLPASSPSLGGCCCTQLSTFPQLQVNQWIESQLPLWLPPNQLLPNTPPISLDHSLQVHYQTRSIAASQCISELMITALKCISKLAPLQPPGSRDHGLQLHLQTRAITASKCISTPARTWLHSASPNSLHHGLQMHRQTRSIMGSTSICKLTRSQPPNASLNLLNHDLQVHHDCVMAGVARCSGNGGGLSDGEYIFGIPRGR